MKIKLLLATLLLAQTSAFAAPRLPAEIYQPSHAATLLKAKVDNDGEVTAKWQVHHINMQRLIRDVERQARKHGYRVASKDVNVDETDMTLLSRNRRLDVSIDLNNDNSMDYKVNLEFND